MSAAEMTRHIVREDRAPGRYVCTGRAEILVLESSTKPHRVKESSERAAVQRAVILVDHGDGHVTLTRGPNFFGEEVASVTNELQQWPRSVMTHSHLPSHRTDLRAARITRVNGSRTKGQVRSNHTAHGSFVQVENHVRRLCRLTHVD